MKKSPVAVLFPALVYSFFVQFLMYPGLASATLAKADRVVVLKGERVLMLLKDGSVLKTYKVALGRNPVGRKIRQGDTRTPEGKYYLDWRNENSRFYRALHISYPNAKDIQKAKAHRVSPGSNIMIHGLPKGYDDVGEWHRSYDWTKGCIAVTNSEIDEIWTLVPDGTPIEIRP